MINLHHRFPSLFVVENWVAQNIIICTEKQKDEMTHGFPDRIVFTNFEWEQHLKDIKCGNSVDYGVKRLTHIPTGDCVEIWFQSLGTHYDKNRGGYVHEQDEHIILWPKALGFLYGEDLVNMQNWFKRLANIAPTNQSEYNSTNIPDELRAQERYK
jgi:hypothetical protein